MNIFCFPSESVNHVCAAYGVRQWAANSSVIADGFRAQLVTKMSQVQRGDLGFLYCTEDKKFHLPFTIDSLPCPQVQYSPIWNSEWIGQFSFIPWLGFLDKGLPIDEVEEVMPTIKQRIESRPQTESGRATAWSNYLRFSGVEVFNPQPHMTLDDFARMVIYLQLVGVG